MKAPTATEFAQLLESVFFVDLHGLTRHDWEDIQDIAAQMQQAGLYGGDGLKCIVASFAVWFSDHGCAYDDRTPTDDRH